MTRALLAASLATVLIVPQPSVTAARPSSNMTVLGTLGGALSDAFAINNDAVVAQVVGWSHTPSDAVHAFVWTEPGPMIDLGTLGGGFSQALAINNHRQIAGHGNDALNLRWAVVWTNTGGAWVIEKLPIIAGTCPAGGLPICSSASGINNGSLGDPGTVAVVGSSRVSSTASHAVMWTKSATGWTVQDLGALPGDTSSRAAAVNDHREIVGTSGRMGGVTNGFLWTAAIGMRRLPSLGGDTLAMAINNDGDVAGVSTTAAGNARAVRWRAATSWAIEDLGTLGGCCSQGNDINSSGDVVGFSRVAGRRVTNRAFLLNASGMTSLSEREESVAWALNDFGVVVGNSRFRSRLSAVIWRVP